MSGFAYYIPAIIVIAVIGVVVFFLFTIIRNIVREKRGESTCSKCKAAAAKTTRYPYLFLIPVSFGDAYSDAENYLRRNMMPILSRNQIPTGQRACKAEVFDCPRCGSRQIEITDFLLVRGEDCDKGFYTFSYESFRPLLENWENMNMNINMNNNSQRNFN